jgi:Mn2+/Fe2+ NRAMP family transporter
MSAIVMFTAFLTRSALGVAWPLPLVATAVLAVCVAVIGVGKYRGLDLGIKIILALLCVSTLAAVVIALPRADPATLSVWPGELIGGVVPFAFLLALVGWMPSPIDVAVWSSLWTLAKDKASGVRTSVRHARRDFLIGYLGTAVLAFAFVLLGATVLFQSGAALSEQGAAFSMQLVDMYSQTLGSWSRPFVLVAALTTMFSTTLALVDGFPRAIERTLVNLRSAPPPSAPQSSRLYWGTMAALGAIALLVVVGFAGSLTAMVDFATIVSFLTAPVLGYLNLKAVTSSDVPAEHRPGPAMLTLSWVGLVLLGGTGVAYLVSLL